MAAAPPPTRPVSIRTRLLLFLAAFITVLAAVGLAQRWRGPGAAPGELERLYAELDAADPGWRLADLHHARAVVPAVENGALLCVSVGGRLPPIWPPTEAMAAPPGTPANVRLDDERRARLRAELARLAPLRADARRLIDMPRGRYQLDLLGPPEWIRMNLGHTRHAHQTAALLQFDSADRAHDGDITGAVRSAHAAVNAARSLGDEPVPISQLVRDSSFLVAVAAAERALGLGEADEKALAALQQILTEDDRHNSVLTARRGQRAILDAVLDGVAAGRIRLGDVGPLSGDLRFRAAAMPWTIRRAARAQHAALLRLQSRAVEDARRPPHEQPTAERATTVEVSKFMAQSPLVSLFLPENGQIGEAYRRRLAASRCLTALVAAERYRLREKRWPDELGQVVAAGLLAEVPLDPHDGKPLRFRRLPDGVLAYSVGTDGKDHGGAVDPASPWVTGPDFGARLWDVGKRNRPAVTAKH